MRALSASYINPKIKNTVAPQEDFDIILKIYASKKCGAT